VSEDSFGARTQVAVLEEKVNSLRRQVITVTVMGVLVLVVLVGLKVGERGSGDDTIEARNFVVRDTRGQARAVLQCMEDRGVQLVFFRDPLKGDTWRARSRPGPFSFGVRDWGGDGQMLLTAANGNRLEMLPSTFTIGRNGSSLILYAMPNGEGWLVLADSTGAQAVVTAASVRQGALRPRR